MIRRNTWLALLVLAGLIVFAVYLKQKPPAVNEIEASPESESQSLFGPENGLVTSMRIESAAGDLVDLSLGPEDTWFVRQPIEALADQGLVEAAASQIGALQNTKELDLAPEAAGLADPAYTITIGFTGGKSYVLKIGDKTPTETGYYARLDEDKLIIVSSDGIDGLLGLLTTLPYNETPTPSPLPASATPIPAADTPEAPVTPTP